MATIIRFGVSMEHELLSRFDDLIEQKGYTNRSEAIRDIVRDTLVEEATGREDEEVLGVITFVYDHHKHELDETLNHFQHDHFQAIVSSTHVHIDQDNCLEVVIMRGKAGLLKHLAQHLLAFKGVKHGHLNLTMPLADSGLRRSHEA